MLEVRPRDGSGRHDQETDSPRFQDGLVSGNPFKLAPYAIKNLKFYNWVVLPALFSLQSDFLHAGMTV